MACCEQSNMVLEFNDIDEPSHVLTRGVIAICWPGAVVTVYVPNAGQGLKRIDYRLQSWCARLASLICGSVAAHDCRRVSCLHGHCRIRFAAVVQGRRIFCVPDRPPGQEARHHSRHVRRCVL